VEHFSRVRESKVTAQDACSSHFHPAAFPGGFSNLSLQSRRESGNLIFSFDPLLGTSKSALFNCLEFPHLPHLTSPHLTTPRFENGAKFAWNRECFLGEQKYGNTMRCRVLFPLQTLVVIGPSQRESGPLSLSQGSNRGRRRSFSSSTQGENEMWIS